MKDRSIASEETENGSPPQSQETSGLRFTFVRSVKIASFLLIMLLLALAIAAWLAGGDANLPFEYEGFD